MCFVLSSYITFHVIGSSFTNVKTSDNYEGNVSPALAIESDLTLFCLVDYVEVSFLSDNRPEIIVMVSWTKSNQSINQSLLAESLSVGLFPLYAATARNIIDCCCTLCFNFVC